MRDRDARGERLRASRKTRRPLRTPRREPMLSRTKGVRWMAPAKETARQAIEQATDQVAAGFAGFFAFAFDFFAVVVAGAMVSGLPAGAAAAALGSGPERKKARHCG